jgi:hypothetical protein
MDFNPPKLFASEIGGTSRDRGRGSLRDVLVNGEPPKSIDWSSTNNPLGTSVMSSVRNQVQHRCSFCSLFQS